MLLFRKLNTYIDTYLKIMVNILFGTVFFTLLSTTKAYNIDATHTFIELTNSIASSQFGYALTLQNAGRYGLFVFYSEY